MKTMGQGDSTKWIIPMDLAAMAGPIVGAVQGFGQGAGSASSS